MHSVRARSAAEDVVSPHHDLELRHARDQGPLDLLDHRADQSCGYRVWPVTGRTCARTTNRWPSSPSTGARSRSAKHRSARGCQDATRRWRCRSVGPRRTCSQTGRSPSDPTKMVAIRNSLEQRSAEFAAGHGRPSRGRRGEGGHRGDHLGLLAPALRVAPLAGRNDAVVTKRGADRVQHPGGALEIPEAVFAGAPASASLSAWSHSIGPRPARPATSGTRAAPG